MFIETKNFHNEQIILNTDRIEMILRQQDGDVFVYLANGEHVKLHGDIFDKICQTLTVAKSAK